MLHTKAYQDKEETLGGGRRSEINESNEYFLLFMIIYLIHSGQLSSRYDAYFRKYRLFTNDGVVETATLWSNPC